jgi:hypothetical protein
MTINQQSKIRVVFLAHSKTENGTAHQITQHIRYGLTPLPFRTLLPSVATSYILRAIYKIPNPTFGKQSYLNVEVICIKKEVNKNANNNTFYSAGR